MYVNKYL